jgi:hypothetical protein
MNNISMPARIRSRLKTLLWIKSIALRENRIKTRITCSRTNPIIEIPFKDNILFMFGLSDQIMSICIKVILQQGLPRQAIGIKVCIHLSQVLGW